MTTRTLINFKNFFEDSVTGVSQRSSWTVLKTDSGHVALLAEIIFKCYPERFFSSSKKTIVLYLVRKFETLMVIFISGGKCVFLNENFWYIGFTDKLFYSLNLNQSKSTDYQWNLTDSNSLKEVTVNQSNSTDYFSENWLIWQ